MADFEKTKKTIGVESMDDRMRADMLSKFKSAGGQVLSERDIRRKEKLAQNEGTSKKSQKSQTFSRSSTSDKAGDFSSKNRGGSSSAVYIEGDNKNNKPVVDRQTLEQEMGSIVNRFVIRFKCWANHVTKFRASEVLPEFMSEMNLEAKIGLMEFNMVGNDLLGNPDFTPRIMKELDKLSPLYVELIARAHKLLDMDELTSMLEGYNMNPYESVPLSKISQPIYSLFRKLYYLYPFQATYKKAVITGYEILQILEKKPAIIYSTKKKKVGTEISNIFDKIFYKLYLLILRNENKNIPLSSGYMEELIGIRDSERPGKRRVGESLSINEKEEEKEDSSQKDKKEEVSEEQQQMDKELAYGLSLMNYITIPDLRKKHDRKNEYPFLPNADKCFLSFMFLKEFDYEYSFILTTKKIILKQNTTMINKMDNRQKMLDIYELYRPCIEQFRIYVDLLQEISKHRSNPGKNYIEASKKNQHYDNKRISQSRNTRNAIKDYVDKSLDAFSLLIEDMKDKKDIVTNPDDPIVFDSIESKKRLHKKTVKECITDAYCYTLAFSYRLNEGDLFGGVVELTPDEMKRSFGTESKSGGSEEAKKEKAGGSEEETPKPDLVSNDPEGFDVIENSIDI
ncbi:MAG: hypothetical protein KDK90_18310 [Leptospiraceae bacterium]|nr:hypothetical protein [Leptospiraceae bacterium]